MRRHPVLLIAALCACSKETLPPDDPGPDLGGADSPTSPGSPDAGDRPGSDGGGGGAPWTPPPGTSWQWQLTGELDTSLDVAMYDIELEAASEETVRALHDAGRVVICYFSAGSYENWRTDLGGVDEAAIGNVMDGWPDERWFDIRDATVRALAASRMDRARDQGCDGVEPDNVDGYSNDTGFPLTAADQLDFNRFLADTAHERGLSVGLKNDVEQVPALEPAFDWALNESCMDWNECEDLTPFIAAGKAVFHVEYGPASLASSVCPVTRPLGLSTLIKRDDLDAWRVACD
jgi:hypothetical protein